MAQTAAATSTKKKTVDKNEKLKKLAAVRVPRAIKAIGLIGNLAQYKPTTEQAVKIAKALHDAVNSVEGRLKAGVSDDPKFEM